MRPSLRTAGLAATLLGVLLAPMTVRAWWNADWGYRKQIVIDAGALPAGVSGQAANLAVPVRLHSGNFGFFMDTREDGGDLRFVAGDDRTPLKHQIEKYDLISGVGIAWVQIPSFGSKEVPEHIWMYYGNPGATGPTSAAHPYDVNQMLVLHFAETTGIPRDAGPVGHVAAKSTATLGAPGVIDSAAAVDGTQSLAFQGLPGLAVAAGGGYTISGWLKAASTAEEGVLFQHGAAGGSLRVGQRAGQLYATLQDRGTTVTATSSAPLGAERWHHFAVSLGGGELKVYLDGRLTASAAASLPALDGNVMIGAVAGAPGFKGSIDELQIASAARTAEWLTAQFLTQSADSEVLVVGEDETANGSGLGAKYLQLLSVTIEKMSLDGWLIIGLAALLGFVSIDVIISKVLGLSRTERADKAFLDVFRSRGHQAMVDMLLRRHGQEVGEEWAQAYRHSTLYPLFKVAVAQMSALIHAGEHIDQHKLLSPQTIESVRSNLDVALVEQTNRLNGRMVWMTLAVSGAPFLGLLGTVLGVMITFTSVAASGDVNVATIAPGVASAMATTVVGLIVAIPSLLAYNYLASQVARMTSLMEVFSEQLVDSLLLFVSNVRSQAEHAHKAHHHAA